jgi:hypothetical protein
MKETVFLTVTRNKVEKLTKQLPYLKKGEYVIAVDVDIKEDAFNEPTIRKSIVVENWHQGIDVSDIEFSEPYITEEEAEIIRSRREQQLIESLQAKGYEIKKPEATTNGGH